MADRIPIPVGIPWGSHDAGVSLSSAEVTCRGRSFHGLAPKTGSRNCPFATVGQHLTQDSVNGSPTCVIFSRQLPGCVYIRPPSGLRRAEPTTLTISILLQSVTEQLLPLPLPQALAFRPTRLSRRESPALRLRSHRHESESGFPFTGCLSLVQASPARVERSRSVVQAHNSTLVYWQSPVESNPANALRKRVTTFYYIVNNFSNCAR